MVEQKNTGFFPQGARCFVVVGLGATGLSCVRFLAAHGCSATVLDTRDSPPYCTKLQEKYPNFAFIGGVLDENVLDTADVVLLSPGVPIDTPAIMRQIERGVPVMGDIELFARVVKAPVIAITGSNGKSTVTSLMGHALSHCGHRPVIGGNWGVPALDLLLDAPEATEYLLELSSFQLETITSLRPEVSVVLNICEDHLDRYAGMNDYIAAKQSIYEHCKTAVINRDDAVSHNGLPAATPYLSFGLGEPDSENALGVRVDKGQCYLAKGAQCLLPTQSLPMPGEHNVANALAVLALGSAISLPMARMLEALLTFEGLPHRCQKVRQHQGITWYNDSKATNVGACLAAVSGLSKGKQGNVVLIAGGEGKDADFSPLKTITPHLRAVVLMGRDRDQLADIFEGVIPMNRVDTMRQAVEECARLAQPGDAVLLAPACASFDQFSNFMERGEAFMDAVKEL